MNADPRCPKCEGTGWMPVTENGVRRVKKCDCRMPQPSVVHVPPLEGPDDERDDRIERAFRKFHSDNPQVYEMLCALAREAKAAGFGGYAIAGLFERLRWHFDVELRGSQALNLNNNFRSRYARLIMEQEPDLKDFFEVRELTEAR